MNYVVAVSGGVDSVVLLDMLTQTSRTGKLVVAHFDHGIRADSAADARFVRALAEQYGLPFESRREYLGADASEALARERRYLFLNQIAQNYNAELMTAHHANDIIETMAINLTRGTGWRGLAVMDNVMIKRPLLSLSKDAIYAYALSHHLEWVEDSTNLERKYLRNRLRMYIGRDVDARKKQKVLSIWHRQCEVKKLIEVELSRLGQRGAEQSRYFLIQSDEKSAMELLRGMINQVRPVTPTRPQLERALLAIKTAQPGSVFQIGDQTQLRFTKRTFIVETT